LLGAGLRAGEAFGRGARPRRTESPDTINDSVEDRLAAIEKRLGAAPAVKVPAEEVPIRARDYAEREAAAPNRSERGPRDRSVEQIERRLNDLEEGLKRRVSRLESEVSGHSEAITELRSCSLRNEESVRRLLGGIERLIDAQAPLHSGPLRTVKPAGGSAAVRA
jgi:hypothetical protein